MAQHAYIAHEVRKRSGISHRERQTRREQVLTRGVPSITRSIADAISIKTGNIFFLTQPNGNVPLGGEHGLGLYYHDCRYLNGYEFQLAGADPVALAGMTGNVGSATFELCNPQLKFRDGEHLSTGEIGVAWNRDLDGIQIQLSDRLTFKNYAQKQLKFPITLTFEADFEDIFSVRGLLLDRPGKLRPPKWQKGNLVFAYDGGDGRFRSLVISFSPQPDLRHLNSVRYRIVLDPLESKEIVVSLAVIETAKPASNQTRNGSQQTNSGLNGTNHEIATAWYSELPEFHSDSLLLDQVLGRAIHDLQSLRSSIGGEEFFAAGVPWFATLFGRDSLITAMQMLAIKPDLAAETLRLLATYQARESDPWRDAQPGKILHELRVGELATLGEIPQTPYYGTVDATPLFLILMGKYVAWTGDIDLFNELRESMDLALRWIESYGDSDGDGYVDYQTTSGHGLANQGWKDSGNSILNADGSRAKPPIALVEVQGYVYRAKLELAYLYERTGHTHRAEALRHSAEELRSKFNQDFWRDELGTYALALQARGAPAMVVSSNPGHALWAGIADPEKAQRTAERLMAKDMFSGWGIRTLSQQEKGYNPIGYHLGSVWPHDTAMIAEGFRCYGFDEAARRVFTGLLAAAVSFEEFRLPELFSGFSRDEYSAPVHYPVACHPQAWAAGSIPFLLCSFLGLEPDALNSKLTIRRPMLPESVNSLDVSRLRVGKASVDLHYSASADGHAAVKVLNVRGDLDVSVV